MKNSLLQPASTGRAFIIMLAVMMVSLSASDMYVPSLPKIHDALNTSAALAQLTITVYFLGLALSQLIYGPLSDQFGRRKILCIGLGIGVIGSLIAFSATDIYTLLVGRFIQACGAAVSIALMRAVIADLYSGVRMAKAASYAATFITLAPALAPIFGGYLESWYGWRSSFAVLSVSFTLAMAVVFYGLPETNRNLIPGAFKPRIMFKNYKLIVSERSFIGYTVASGLSIASLIIYYTLSPYLFQDVLGLSPRSYGWTAFVVMLGMIAGCFINTRLVDRMSGLHIIMIGCALMLLASMAMLVIGLFGWFNVPVVVLPMIVILFASSLVFTNSSSGAMRTMTHIAGSAGAVFGGSQMLMSFMGSALASQLSITTQQPLAILLVVNSVLVSLSIYFLVARSRVPQASVQVA